MFKDEHTKQANRDPYEAEAESYLNRQGLKTLVRNYSIKAGEIDLIMRDSDGTLVFVEVKYRKSTHYGSGLEAVTPQKIKKLTTTANYFLKSNNLANHQPCRFDIVSMSKSHHADQFTFDWLTNAIEQCY